MITARTSRQPIPVLRDADVVERYQHLTTRQKLFATLDALRDLGCGELHLTATELPLAFTSLHVWASMQELQVLQSTQSIRVLHRDGHRTLCTVTVAYQQMIARRCYCGIEPATVFRADVHPDLVYACVHCNAHDDGGVLP